MIIQILGFHIWTSDGIQILDLHPAFKKLLKIQSIIAQKAISLCLLVSSNQKVSKIKTIQQLDDFWTFEYWTSLVFRSPLY